MFQTLLGFGFACLFLDPRSDSLVDFADSALHVFEHFLETLVLQVGGGFLWREIKNNENSDNSNSDIKQ